MKRITAMFLAIVMMLTMLFSLSGCSATTADNALLMGQWVTLVADSFGMESYTEKTPYFKNVASNSLYFAAFQMAAEWNIITPSDTIGVDTPVKWKDVLVSLVNAGEFLDENATEEEKINYAIENFDNGIREYWGDRYIKLKEAIPLLDTAQYLWAQKGFSEKIEKTSFVDGVLDLIDREDVLYECDGEKIIASAEIFQDLKVGDVYVLPANLDNDASINRVKDIEFVGENVIIQNDENFTEDEVSEYIEEIRIQETSAPNFLSVAGIYDENGNTIEYEIEDTSLADGLSYSENKVQIDTLVYTENQSEIDVEQTSIFEKVKGTLKFKVDGYSVALTLTKDSVSLKLAKEIAKSTNRYREQTTEVYEKVTFKDVVLTRDIDYSWGKLHSATIKLDYKTTIEGGIKTERKTEIGNPIKDKDDETRKTLSSTIKQYKKALETIKNDVCNTKCNEDIYICKLALIEGGVASVDFIIKGEITAEGEMKLSFEIEGAQGIQYKDGNLRYIKTKDVDVDFIAEGSMEATISPGIAINLLKKIALVEFTIDTGLGGSVSGTAHLFDIEGHELYSTDTKITAEDANNLSNEELYTTVEEIQSFAESVGGAWNAKEKGITGDVTLFKGVCLEWKLYPILRVGLSGTCVVGEIAKKLNVSASIEVLGSENTVLKGHIDFPNNISNVMDSDSIGNGLAALFGVGAECTYDYTPWDEAVEKMEEVEETATQVAGAADTSMESTDMITSDTIILSTMRVALGEGASQQITVTGLPEGYELGNLVAESEDPDIATFDIKQGIITGNKEGITQLVVKTKDGKYKAYCAIIVTTDKTIDFNELPNGGMV